MPGVMKSQTDWDLQVDDEGHRDYTLHWDVVTALGDGPNVALYGAGMPVPGTYLATDPGAFYQRRGGARLKKIEGSKRYWDCTTVFTTRPTKRCETSQFENPLMEPPRVRGGFNRYTEEIREDKDGNAILNSAKEPITGLQRDRNRPTIELEMNVIWINATFLASYCDAVNSDPWWNQPPRTIKCATFTWERMLYGTCLFYFHMAFQFELKSDLWDIQVLDQGNMVVIPGTNPPKYRRAKDQFEETCRVLLDNNGNATLTPTYRDPKFRVYQEKPFASVGWPVTLI